MRSNEGGWNLWQYRRDVLKYGFPVPACELDMDCGSVDRPVLRICCSSR